MSEPKQDWRELCEQATKEQDPKKLLTLISEIVQLLDDEKRNDSAKPSINPDSPKPQRKSA